MPQRYLGIATFLILSASTSFAGQVTIEGPPGALILYDVNRNLRSIGSSVAEIDDLARERQTQIFRLKGELDRCGDCSDHGRLQSELDYWTTLDRSVNAAEHVALQSAGLGQYGDFKSFRQALAEALLNPNRPPTQAERHQRAVSKAEIARNTYCNAVQNAAPRDQRIKINRECPKEFDPELMVVQDEAARNFCFDMLRSNEDHLPDVWKKDWRWIVLECMDQNSPVEHLKMLSLRIDPSPFKIEAMISQWCEGPGLKWHRDPTEDQYQNTSSRVRAVQGCIKETSIDGLKQEQEAAEKACAKDPGSQSGSRQIDMYICVYEHDPLRQMNKTIYR